MAKTRALQTPRRGFPWVRGPNHMYRLLTFVMCYFGPDSVLLINGNIMRIMDVTSLIIMIGWGGRGKPLSSLLRHTPHFNGIIH